MTSLRARFRGLPTPEPTPARALLVAKMRAKHGQLATLTVRARPLGRQTTSARHPELGGAPPDKLDVLVAVLLEHETNTLHVQHEPLGVRLS